MIQSDYEYDEAGTVTTAELGIVAITLNGTLFGTLVYSIITTDGDEAIVIKAVDGKFSATEAGTTTGDYHVDGTTTVAGT